jgi:predicted nucleotidyltransferase
VAPRLFTEESQLEPTEADRELACEIGRAIVGLGHGCVRRIVLIGSRATGSARPDSDLDLVVVVELPPGVGPWRGDDFATSGRELQSALGPRQPRVDIRVRTTDRDAEARDVPGGVEWIAAHGGVPVFEIPPLRSPVVRTARENVRRELVSSWMHHAISALEAFDNVTNPRPPHVIANATIERLIAAVLTYEGVAPRLDRNLGRYVLQLRSGSIKNTLESAIERTAATPRSSAVEATLSVLKYLQRDAQQARYLTRVRQCLDTIASTAGHGGSAGAA